MEGEDVLLMTCVTLLQISNAGKSHTLPSDNDNSVLDTSTDEKHIPARIDSHKWAKLVYVRHNLRFDLKFGDAENKKNSTKYIQMKHRGTLSQMAENKVAAYNNCTTHHHRTNGTYPRIWAHSRKRKNAANEQLFWYVWRQVYVAVYTQRTCNCGQTTGLPFGTGAANERVHGCKTVTSNIYELQITRM